MCCEFISFSPFKYLNLALSLSLPFLLSVCFYNDGGDDKDDDENFVVAVRAECMIVYVCVCVCRILLLFFRA